MGTLRDNDDDQDQDQTAENVEVEEQEETADEGADTNVIEAGAEEQDSRLSADEEDDDREVESNDDEDDKHARRRKESARERRQRAKAAKQHDKEELNVLRITIAKQNERLNQTERALIETRITDFENRAATAQSYVNQWNEVDVKATKAGNVQDAVTARQYRDEAAKQATQYATQAAQLKEALKNPNQGQTQTPPAFTGMAQNFLREIPWYNPKSGDEDSLIVEALDKSLSKQMDPNDPRYWDELRKRVHKRLPNRFSRQTSDEDAEDEDDDMDDDSQQETRQRQAPPRRKGPPTGGSSRTTSGGKVTEIRLPPQMVEAMKEAGQWDDLKVRARVAKRYIDGLRNNRG